MLRFAPEHGVKHTMKKLIIFTGAIILSGCFKFDLAKETVISPGDDPLVNVVYQKLLTSNGIEYTLNSDGYYVSGKSNLGKMTELADEAQEELRNVSTIQIESSCIANKVRAHLVGESFIIYQIDDGMYLKAASSVIDNHRVIREISIAQRECQENV